MLNIKKIKFTQEEFDRLFEKYGGYIWAAIDIHRNRLTAGDEYLADLRDFLLINRGKPQDILCAGINLVTGEVFFPTLMNRRNPLVTKDGIPPELVERVYTIVRYFFEHIPGFKEERKKPRYSKEPTELSFD